jgi:hypothetical protein
MIRDCQPDETIPDPIQQPELFVELEVLTIGPHTFTYSSSSSRTMSSCNVHNILKF